MKRYTYEILSGVTGATFQLPIYLEASVDEMGIMSGFDGEIEQIEQFANFTYKSAFAWSAYGYYNYEFGSNSAACADSNPADETFYISEQYSSPAGGVYVYTNKALTTIFDGNYAYWHMQRDDGQWFAAQIASFGQILSVLQCTSIAPTPSPTGSPCPVNPSVTPTVTPSISIPVTPSVTPTTSPSPTPSVTESPCPVSPTPTPTITPTPSITPSITPSRTPSVTPSRTVTPTRTPSVTPTRTPSRTASPTPTPSETPAPTPSPSPIVQFFVSPSYTFSITNITGIGVPAFSYPITGNTSMTLASISDQTLTVYLSGGIYPGSQLHMDSLHYSNPDSSTNFTLGDPSVDIHISAASGSETLTLAINAG